MDLLLGSLWPGVAVIGLGLILLLVGASRQARPLIFAGLVLDALGTGLLVASIMTQTPAERVDAQTQRLVDLAGPFDAAAFDAVLAPDAVVLDPGGKPLLDRVALRSSLDRWNGRGDAFDHRLVSSDVEMRGDHAASSLIRVRTNGGPAQMPTLTVWEVLWRLDADNAWRVASLRWIQMNSAAPPTDLVR